MPYDLGDTVRLIGECRGPDGALVTAATAALTITLPDGTTTRPPVPAADPVGVYTVDYVPEQAGRHLVRWQWTGPAAAYTDAVDVRPADVPLILSLADARDHLRVSGTSQDENIRAWLEATTRCVEAIVGPVVRRTVVEDHDVSGWTLMVRQPPLLSLTSVTAILAGGTSPALSDLDASPAGVIRRRDGARLTGPLRVTYVAGRHIVPANITAAARIILAHLWRARYGADGLPNIGGADDYSLSEPIPGLGYAVPNRALELLQGDQMPPGVA